MPSKSPKQRRLMAGAANDPKLAKKAGVSQSVAREYNEADQKAAADSADSWASRLASDYGDMVDRIKHKKR